MQIEKAEPKDLSQIAALWHEGWHAGHARIAPAALTALRTAEEFTQRAAAHREQTWVARVEGALAGFFMIDGAEIYQFYVAQDQRGSGMAAQLMQAAEAQMGAGPKWLACSVGNDRAAGFYEKCGWARAGVIPYTVETAQGPLQLQVWRYEKGGSDD